MQTITDCYAETPLSELLIADGMNPMKIWDGLKAAPIDAGLVAPEDSLTIDRSTDPGAIFGVYSAFTRYVDENGNVSSLSPISTTIQAEKAGGTITDASYSTPIQITTSGAHGLSTGHIVLIEGLVGAFAANGTWEITVTGADTFTLDGSIGDSAYTSGGTWRSGVEEILYTDVPVPTSPKVVRKQILRNTDGQAITYYVDVDTTDLNTTSFSSSLVDEVLRTQTAVPLLGENGEILANANNPPPDYMTAIAHHLDSMFAAVNRVYSDGAVKVTNGSTTVEGIGTEWTAALAGRQLLVNGATAIYEIDSVNVAAQTLTLTEAYDDSTAPYSAYGIRPASALEKNVQYSLPGFPQSWLITNSFEVQQDGDRLTGLMQKGSFVYIIEYRHIYKFTYQENPAVDGFCFLCCERGCINNRCWVQVESNTYMLDRAGVHIFSGGQESEPLSSPIQLIFQTLAESNYVINWTAEKLFHAAHFPQEEVVRWFVSMGSNLKPRHAIAVNYRTKRWWIEEYPRPMTASCLGAIGPARVVFLGSEAAKTLIAGVGNLDGIDRNAGVLAGSVTDADLASLTDASVGAFPEGVVGLTVTITGGKGKLQTRTIHATTGGRLEVTLPWAIIPDSTSTYQVGGIFYRFRSQSFDWAETPEESDRKLGVFFESGEENNNAFLRQYRNSDTAPYVWQIDTAGRTNEGISAKRGDAELVLDLSEAARVDQRGRRLPTGYSQIRLADHKDENIDGFREWSFEILGAAGPAGAAFFRFLVDGVES